MKNPYRDILQSSEASLSMEWRGRYADFIRQMIRAWDEGYHAKEADYKEEACLKFIKSF